MTTPTPLPIPGLLDERSRPDLPAVFRSLTTRSGEVDVALLRIRLSGVRLDPADMVGVRRLRLLLAEMSALTLAREAEAIALHPDRRLQLRFLLGLLREGRIEIRCAPLGGWSPDFSVFSGPEGPEATLVGLHWFERPCSHPGPVLAAVHGAEAARALSRRFGRLWSGAHDVADAVLGIMETADARAGGPLPEGPHAPSGPSRPDAAGERIAPPVRG